jgi:selenophosphate synthase
VPALLAGGQHGRRGLSTEQYDQGGGCACKIPPGELEDVVRDRDDDALNAEASTAALEAGVECATDITGFALVGHLYKLARASGVTAVIDSTAVLYLDGAREALAAGYISGGTRRNLDWVRPHVDHESASFITGTVVVADGGHGLPETWPRP